MENIVMQQLEGFIQISILQGLEDIFVGSGIENILHAVPTLPMDLRINTFLNGHALPQ